MNDLQHLPPIHPCACGRPAKYEGTDRSGFVECSSVGGCWTGPARDCPAKSIDEWNIAMDAVKAAADRGEAQRKRREQRYGDRMRRIAAIQPMLGERARTFRDDPHADFGAASQALIADALALILEPRAFQSAALHVHLWDVLHGAWIPEWVVLHVLQRNPQRFRRSGNGWWSLTSEYRATLPPRGTERAVAPRGEVKQ